MLFSYHILQPNLSEIMFRCQETTMDSAIKQTIIFLLIITFPVIIHSKNSCPNSRCGSSYLPINYPFKLETDQPPKYCYNSINLRCDDQSHTVINLPYFGEFYVTDINYNHRKIALTDPGNCLARRFMTNFSVSPLSAFSYENYTFYMCPGDLRIRWFFQIHCLSNSTNVTIVTRADSSEYVEGYGCKPIVSSMIPVSLLSDYYDWQKYGYLELTWDFPLCKHCELTNDPEKPDETKRKVAKLILGSTVFIPLAVVFTTFFAIACCVRFLKNIVGSTTTDNTETGSSAEGSAVTATVAPPQATGGGLSGTTSTTPGTETFKVKNFSQVVVVGESDQETLMICSICLEEYNGEDMVRNLAQCGHLFHAECIDQWLQKNTSCPICRTSLSVF